MGKQDDDNRPLPAGAVRLVAIDLDGTLLRSDGKVGTRSREAIQAALAQGVKVVLASARPPRGARPFYQALGLDTLQINQNGAVVMDPPKGVLVYHQPLDGAVARTVVELARRVEPKVTVGVDIVDRMWGLRGDGKDKAEAWQEMLTAMSRPVSRVMLAAQPDRLSAIDGAISRFLPGKVAYAYSNMNLLQVVHPQVDKVVALELVIKTYGLKPDQVMAIGDAPNDIRMLRWAGLSVAMGNAWANVRKVTHFVSATNDEDGVGVALEKYVLR